MCFYFLPFLQNYLRVALQELNSGCTAKTLRVAPYATVEEVCQLCAQKFKVSEPEQYGLFLVMEGSSQQLAPDNHPQKIKAELHSHSQVGHFHFVFRRIADGSTSHSTPNLNNPTVTPDTKSSLSDSVSLRLSLPPNHLNNNSISVWLKMGSNRVSHLWQFPRTNMVLSSKGKHVDMIQPGPNIVSCK